MRAILKNKTILWGIILIVALPLILGACTASKAATPTTVAIIDGTGARDAALDYLNEKIPTNDPDRDELLALLEELIAEEDV